MEVDALELEQELLAFDAAAVASQTMARFDDPVTGNDNGNRVDVVGLTNGAHRSRCLDLLGDAAVRPHLAPGNLAQRGPYALLEIGAPQIQRHAVELLLLALKVACKRSREFRRNRRFGGIHVIEPLEGKPEQATARPSEPQGPQPVGFERAPALDTRLVWIDAGVTFRGHGSFHLCMRPACFNCMRTEP
jgi:hypothetical protein